MPADRQMPHNLQAEQSVLGCVLMAPTLVDELGDLNVDDFLLPAHREIWDAMLTIAKRGKPVDVLLVMDELKARDWLKRLEDGPVYLDKLSSAVPTASNFRHYVDVVREKARLRQIITLCAEVSGAAFGDAESDELLAGMSERAMKIATNTTNELAHVGPLLEPLMLEFEQRKKRREAGNEDAGVTGARMGISKLDRATGGGQPGDVIVIAAGTGGGKTALAVQTAINVCDDKGSSLVFNLEMPRKQIAERILVHRTEINSINLRDGLIDNKEFAKLQGAAGKTYDQALYIHDDLFTMREIVATARRWRAKHPHPQAGLIALDFLQLIRSEQARGRGEYNRSRELGIYAQTLKELAKKLMVPIILPHNKDESDDCVLDIYVDKLRNGQKVRVKAQWRGRYYQFSDPAIDWVPTEETRRDVYA